MPRYRPLFYRSPASFSQAPDKKCAHKNKSMILIIKYLQEKAPRNSPGKPMQSVVAAPRRRPEFCLVQSTHTQSVQINCTLCEIPALLPSEIPLPRYLFAVHRIPAGSRHTSSSMLFTTEPLPAFRNFGYRRDDVAAVFLLLAERFGPRYGQITDCCYL